MPDPEIISEARETEIEAPSANALSVLNQSEHAAMVATANTKENRRNLDRFQNLLMSYATHSQRIAQSMFYSLPRANKQIIGPGVRFAEIVAPCWRNNSTGSRLIGETRESVTAQGVFIDYEANLRNVKEIPRRITDSQGRRFNADMVLTTAKAALSIAYREAILKGGVPMALWTPAYEQAKLTAVGQAKSMSERITAAMDYLAKLGVTEWQVMNAIGCSSPKDMEIDQLLTIRVLCEEIQKGDRSIEEVFGSPHDKEIDRLFQQLGKNETERRLARQSYMGNAAGLLEYLKGKLPSEARSAPETRAATQQPKEQQEQQVAAQEQPNNSANTAQEQPEAKRRGRPRKDQSAPPQTETTHTAEPAEEQKQEPAVVDEKKPEPEPERKAAPASLF